jgi:hypothetical protein
VNAPTATPEPIVLPPQHQYSASQVETFMLCGRKWAWSKIAKVERAESKSAELGSETHTQLETYLAGGALDYTKESGYIAAAGIHLLPVPNAPGMRIEEPFDFSSVRTRFRWLGRKDIECDDTSIFPDHVGGVPGISDHKTTSGMGWAKKPADLEYDVQANLYAHEACTRTGASAVDLIWTYYQTRGARTAKRVHLRVLSDHAARMFGLIEDVAAEMAEHEKSAARLTKLGLEPSAYLPTMTPNPGACSAFGGCPYEHKCELTTQERVRAIMPGLSLIDSLRKRAAIADGVPAPATEPTVIAAPTPVVAPAINPPESLNAGPPLPPMSRVEGVPPIEGLTAGHEPSPEEVRSNDALEDTGIKNVTIDVKVLAESDETLTGDEAKAVRTEIEKIVEENKPARKTRTPKAEPAPQAAAEPARVDGYVLFVDCVPTKQVGGRLKVTSAAALAEAARPIVQENSKSKDCPEGLADYRFASFGQGPGMLVAAVRSMYSGDIDEVYVDTRTPEGAILLGLLSAHAREIVQAIR